jgi:hypothetical protein
MTLSFYSFSQKRKFTDTTTVVQDTVSTELNDEDSAEEVIDTTGFYQDSLDKAQYNYYKDTSLWPKDTFLLRSVPDSIVKSLQSDDDFWYANKDFKKEQKPGEPRGDFQDVIAGNEWLHVLTWVIIIGGFLTVLIWFLVSSNVGVFRRRSKTLVTGDDTHENENIFEINYQQEINKAIKEDNYRLAVRLMFLRLLKNLSERNIIQYKQGRTNFDYLLQLSSTGYYKDFFRLTRNYEYAWYGGFDVSNETFGIIKNEFEKFDNSLS